VRSSPAALRLAAIVLGVPCVLAVVVYGELSTGALVVVTATGVLLAGAGLAAGAGSAAAPVGRAGLPWLAWALVAGAFELLTLAHADLPTLSDLLDVVLAAPAARAAAAVVWLAAGAWLLTRPAQRPGERM
jgi:hypothetical protein